MKGFSKHKGVTLPITIITFVIVFIFSISILYLVNNQGVSIGLLAPENSEIKSGSIPYQKAINYAEAGYSEYLWHLNDNVNFYLTQESKDMLNKPIEYGDGFYALDITIPSDSERYVTIKSTGWSKKSPEVKKTINVQVQKKQFVHHVYVSQQETMPPNTPVSFGGQDKLYGPVHTNGTLSTINNPGPEFFNTVSYTVRLNETGAPIYHRGRPQKIDQMTLQDTNGELKEWAKLDNAVYYGRTSIHLEGDKIRIKYPNFGTNTPNGTERLLGYKEEVINIPENGVIYIDGKSNIYDKWEPHSGNLFISGELSGELTIAAKDSIYITQSDPTKFYDDHQWYPGGVYYNNGNVSPPSVPTPINNGGITYKNTKFQLDSKTGEVKISGQGKDMLGLVANNNITILHYGWLRDGSDGEDHFLNYRLSWNRRIGRWSKDYLDSRMHDVAPYTMEISAALFALNEGFGFEDYGDGVGKGNILIWGNITQNRRYAVRIEKYDKYGQWKQYGYGKQYVHDPRMFYHYPPHILEPINSGWEVRDWKEVNDHVSTP